MPARYVLYFTAAARELWRRGRGEFAPVASFAPDEAGAAAFAGFVRAQRTGLFSFVADLAGEVFHEERIAWLRGAERRAVVERRLAQRFRDAALAVALPLGVVAGERRDERLLLASFSNPQQFDPWLAAIRAAGARLEGLYSAPLLAPALAARLGERRGSCFIVVPGRAGLRQCLLQDGRLRFARLEALPAPGQASLARFAYAETLRLAQYLTTQRLLPRGGPAPRALLLAPPGRREEFERELNDGAPDADTPGAEKPLVFRVVETDAALRALGVRGALPAAGAEAIHVALASARPPALQFAGREARREFLLWRTGRALLAAGALGLAAGALGAALLWRDAFRLGEERLLAQAEARAAVQRHAQWSAALPMAQGGLDDLGAALEAYRRVSAQPATPEPMLARLAQVLQAHPAIRVDTLGWRAAAAEAGAAQEGAEVLEVTGRIDVPPADRRRLAAAAAGFAAALGDAPGYRLLRTRLPFDPSSESVLSADLPVAAPEVAEPGFGVVLARRAP